MTEDNRTEQELQELKKRLSSAESREADLQTQVADLKKLNEALQHVSGHLELETITREFEDAIRGTVPFDFVSIALYRNERQWELLTTGELVTAPATIGTAGSATDWVVKNRRPLIRGNVLKEDRFRLSDRTREIGIQSDIILPLIAQDQVIGSASVASLQEGAYSRVMSSFSSPCSTTLRSMWIMPGCIASWRNPIVISG
jgi:transcriptional regulator with GAF, ATPase, and Fis domain